MPVATFVAVTEACGKTPPLESRTVPRIEDVSRCAQARGHARTVITTVTPANTPRRMTFISLSPLRRLALGSAQP